jgi:hypothetical protein
MAKLIVAVIPAAKKLSCGHAAACGQGGKFGN